MTHSGSAAATVSSAYWPESREGLGRFLVEHRLVGVGAEVGVFLGNFSQSILAAWPGKLVLIDAWRNLPDYNDPWNFDDARFEQIFTAARERVRSFGTRAQIVRQTSGEAVCGFADSHFDFVYVDADHSYRGCRHDLEAWWPKLRPGGLFCGHDYLHGILQGREVMEVPEPTEASLAAFGVKAAVDEFAAAHSCAVRSTADHPASWWFFKPAPT